MVASLASQLNVAVVQLSSQDDCAANLQRARVQVAQAAGQGAELVLLPENFAFMGDEQQKRAIAEDLAGPPGRILDFLQTEAAERGIWIAGGGMPIRSPDPSRPYNASVLVGPEGKVDSVYRKIHLFDVRLPDGSHYSESSSTMAGDEVVSIGVGPLQVGLTICYDLRFPELYRRLSERGCHLLTVPAAFTMVTGKDHWHPLLRARAIENQCYVAAAAQSGVHPKGRLTYGKACIIDPWGDVIAQVPDGEGCAVATLSLGRIEAVRSSLPSLRHRKL